MNHTGGVDRPHLGEGGVDGHQILVVHPEVGAQRASGGIGDPLWVQVAG